MIVFLYVYMYNILKIIQITKLLNKKSPAVT